MTPIKYVISLLLVLTGPLAYGAYDAIVGAGQTVTFRCNSASDSDCKITDGLGTSQVDTGFAYSWKAVRNKEPFEEPFEDVGSFVGEGDGNSGREVEWTAPDEGIEVKVIVTADSLEDKDPDKGDSDSWTIAVVGVDLSIDGVEAVDEDDPGGFIEKGELKPIHLEMTPSSIPSGTLELSAVQGTSKILLWGDVAKTTPIAFGEQTPPENGTVWAANNVPQTTYWVQGFDVSSTVGDIELKLCYKDDGGIVIAEDSVTLTVVEVKIKNPVNPNKGVSNDSDDFFFRGPSETNVKVYYDFLPTGLTAASAKLLIKEGGSILGEITLSTSSGANLLAQWNGKGISDEYFNKWDFRAVIEVVIGGVAFTSNEHPIAELLYKHRPLVHIHNSEFAGPINAEFMMNNADLWDKSYLPDERVAEQPLIFSELSSHDTTDHYQNLDDNHREGQGAASTNTVYCRGTTASGHAFLQYWHFEPSSSVADFLTFWHEGDWEMFQIAVKLDTSAEELKPIAVTGSQHYYGQTIRWDETGNGPESQDQDYVEKSGHRPLIYVALETHATYFRVGDFRTRTGSDNHGDQYEEAPTVGHLDDETGMTDYTYALTIFHNSMISHWLGLWGADLIRYGDGPPSPRHRETAVNMWTDPRGFNNYYRKLDSYPGGNPVHSDTYIP